MCVYVYECVIQHALYLPVSLGLELTLDPRPSTLTLTLSASLLAMSEDSWYLMTGHFFSASRTDVRPWVERASMVGSQLRP